MSDVLKFPEKVSEVNATLDAARLRGLTKVLILSDTEDGELVCLSNSEMTVSELNWLCDRAKAWVLRRTR